MASPRSSSRSCRAQFTTSLQADINLAACGSPAALRGGAPFGGEPADDGNAFLGLLLSMLFPILLIGVFLWFMFRQAQGSNNQAMSFGRSRARMFLGSKTVVTFDDVAGVDEAKKELQEVVEFLQVPREVQRRWARASPRRAAGRARRAPARRCWRAPWPVRPACPSSASRGSEFVEMFVGVGASRVRDLFDQAKRNSPCIVFVDEIDAVGRQRGAGLGGSHDEREQTLNQILVEMDGFDTDTNVIVVAATNRPDILDPALLRPGRFDRQVILDRPDMKGRLEILNVHVKGKPLDKDDRPAQHGQAVAGLLRRGPRQPGERGRHPGRPAQQEDHRHARVPRGHRAGRRRTGAQAAASSATKRRRIIAYHEAGHALVQRMLPKCDPVRQGHHHQPRHGPGLHHGPARSRTATCSPRPSSRTRSPACSAARVAERLIFGDITTGASNDIEKATTLARRMVTEFGMSEELGPLAFGKREEMVFLGREIGEQRNYSDEVAKKIDDEVRAIIDRGYARATEVLTTLQDRLTELAEALVAKETIDAEEFEAMFADLPDPRKEAGGSPDAEAGHSAGAA